MASQYTFQISSPALTGNKSFSTQTDQDAQDLLDWSAVAYKAIVDELYNPSHNPAFTPTNAQKGVALATGTVRAWTDAVQKWKNDASHAAVPVPPPMGWS
jgi:hypothetical protein